MARRKSKFEFAPQSDPAAPLDSAAFLAAAGPVHRHLIEDLVARADQSKAVTAALNKQWRKEQAAGRTADGYQVWRRRLAGQVSSAWILSVVFARTLEDRGLVDQNRIAGPGAEDSQKVFFQLAPYLTERDYLYTVFRELCRLPAARELFGEKHNLVWRLAPSAEGARQLLALFRNPTAETPCFRFGQRDSRFLGDLYQDLDEEVRKRFALLQTPDFVESFILDNTLEPAIKEFGLDGLTLIDPTCGSGHFLLGAFERLLEHRLEQEPGRNPRQAAMMALDAVYGTDINPYAVAVARFRLTLAFLDKAGFSKLREASQPKINVCVADSLLHGLEQKDLAEMADEASRGEWLGELFELEDVAEAERILGRRHHVVVGNPPYITVKDKQLRLKYRDHYRACHREYQLVVPFVERFFKNAGRSGYIGAIIGNGFMKREFGKKLIEEVLPQLDLTGVVDTSGAYIPGHGTPTAILFGRNRARRDVPVHAVLGNRGEPSTPENPSEGLVWSSIRDNWNSGSFENDFITVINLTREKLDKHPWSLGGGGSAELMQLIEQRSIKRLSDVVDIPIGRAARTGQDDILAMPPRVTNYRKSDKSLWRPLLTGEGVRDWSLQTDDLVWFPYDPDNNLKVLDLDDSATRHLWPWKKKLESRATFQGKMSDAGLQWYEYMQYTPSANRTPLAIAFAFVASHNHFVLDRGGKVFKQSAPIIKLPEGATEDEHLAMLGYLNSSTVNFWLKNVMFQKYSANQKHNADLSRIKYEFAGEAMKSLPVPERHRAVLARLSAEADRIGNEISQIKSGLAVRDSLQSVRSSTEIKQLIDENWRAFSELQSRLVVLQEEIDWIVYDAFGLLEGLSIRNVCDNAEKMLQRRVGVRPGGRPFERSSGHHQGFTERIGVVGEPLVGEREVPEHWIEREALLGDQRLKILETIEFKRTWRFSEMNVHPEKIKREISDNWLKCLILDQAESIEKGSTEINTTATIWSRISGQMPVEESIFEHLFGNNIDSIHAMGELISEEAVPGCSALRYTATGLEKRAAWERTWDLQRREDAGEKVDIPVPPKYAQTDFQSPIYWRHRGKLDVPKERFISYPGCESDEDKQPVYGWAGWNHLQQAQALVSMYFARKDDEGWERDRLMPMLCGLRELIPWLKQWHNEPDDEYDGLKLGDYFEGVLQKECNELGLTDDDLVTWRPPKRKSARVRKKVTKHKTGKDEEVPA